MDMDMDMNMDMGTSHSRLFERSHASECALPVANARLAGCIKLKANRVALEGRAAYIRCPTPVCAVVLATPILHEAVSAQNDGWGVVASLWAHG